MPVPSRSGGLSRGLKQPDPNGRPVLHSLAGLREAGRRSKHEPASRRVLALALVPEGSKRTEAARAAGMDRQTLRDWVHG